MMDDENFDKFITNKQYKESDQFNQNPKSLMRLVNYVKNLPLTQDSFSKLYGLVKFYRTPLFIACLPLYEKVTKNKNECNQEIVDSIKQIATFVKGYLEGYNLQQLNFFYVFGTSKKKKKLGEKSQTEIAFINYIQNLGMHIRKLNKQLNDINPEQIKLQVDSILAGGLERKLNPLQFYYEQYFKNEADRIYKQHIQKINYFQESHFQKGIQLRPEPGQEKKVPLCCRTYFYDQQTIKEPQNLVIEYKNYRFPFVDHQFKILKKTICGFLNTDGGTIFLGIYEDVNTKIRNVAGMQLNSADREQLIFTLRKDVLEQIDPDIISNKSYSIVFVPVKQRKKPYRYISGRCIVKIIVKYGIRNEIYSYKNDFHDLFAFRTENEVIHREGRDVLNAYRQRLKSPLPIPIPIHEGVCKQPQQGQVEGFQKRQMPEKMVQKKPKAFKQKDAIDFVIEKITQKDLIRQLNESNLGAYAQTSSDSKKKICFLKIKQKEIRNELIEFLSRLQYQQKCTFYQSQRGILLENEGDLNFVKSELDSQQYSFNINNKQKGIIIEFRSTEEAMSAFLFLKESRGKMILSFYAI